MIKSALVAAIAIVSVASGAEAATVLNFSHGVTLRASSPTYTAVSDGAPPASLTGTVVRYDTFAFTVDTTGTYTLNLGTSGGFHPYLTLYNSAFDAASPLTNAIAAKSSPSGFGAAFTTTLTAGTSYVTALAGTIYAPSPDGGAFGVLAVSGPGTVTAGAGAAATVPEPATWAMMVGGFGLVGSAMRRRTVSAYFA